MPIIKSGYRSKLTRGEREGACLAGEGQMLAAERPRLGAVVLRQAARLDHGRTLLR
jgi:hypothetical protein